MRRVNDFLIGVILLQILYLYARCSSFYIDPEYYQVKNEEVFFHDPESEAMFKLLLYRLQRSGLEIDLREISDVCAVDSLETEFGDRSVLGRHFYGSILIEKEVLQEDILLGYWVMAHEVLHSQGRDHDPQGTLMAPTIDAYYYARAMDLSIDAIIVGHFSDYLKSKK